VPFLIGESDWRTTNPLPHPPFPKIHSIKLLFNVIKKSRNYVFEDAKPPRALGTRVEGCGLWAYKVYIERMIV